MLIFNPSRSNILWTKSHSKRYSLRTRTES
jgi:hypothetical protein